MKVDIGPYKDWVGPYQIADLLFKRLLGEDRAYKIGEWLSNTPLLPLCEWIDSHRHRRLRVRIDQYDTWNMNDTLAVIILPMLKQLKATKQGAPLVENEDVPEDLWRPKEYPSWETDPQHFRRWDYVLDQMIHAFERTVDDSWVDQYRTGTIDYKFVDGEMVFTDKHTYKADYEGLRCEHDRIQNGFRLFGKYYQALWD